ncbi:hypothetical protein ACFCW6_27835 [Streptomyces sp. NPDC056333]|uniref:hypothetical protein n=1 Tax=Streptomyces sp. NPDC056333 TaxID=3345786 RepID=UPI0035E30814
MLATTYIARGGPVTRPDLHRAGGDHRQAQVRAVPGFPEGADPGRSPKARPTPWRRRARHAGPTEPGNVIVMFFQTPIYE